MVDKHYVCLDFANENADGMLRRALHDVLAAQATGARPPRDALLRLERHLAKSFRRPRLVRGAGVYELEWGEGTLLARVVRSAVDLLTSSDAKRLRVCAADDCDWVFIDRSKNGSRRWCDMKTCGNRAKARRYYARWA